MQRPPPIQIPRRQAIQEPQRLTQAQLVAKINQLIREFADEDLEMQDSIDRLDEVIFHFVQQRADIHPSQRDTVRNGLIRHFRPLLARQLGINEMGVMKEFDVNESLYSDDSDSDVGYKLGGIINPVFLKRNVIRPNFLSKRVI